MRGRRFTKDARAAVLAASRECSAFRDDDRVGTEHLLVGAVLGSDSGIDAARLRDELERMDRDALRLIGVEADLEGLPPRVRRGSPRFTSGAKECLVRSLKIAKDRRDRVITRDHILAAVASGDERDTAVRLLRRLEIDPRQFGAEALARLDRY